MDEITATEFLARLRTEPAPNAAQEYAVAGTVARRLRVVGEVSLRGQVFTRPVRLEYLDFTHPVDFAEARIEGSLRMESCNFFAGLCLRDLQVQGLLSLRLTELDNPTTKWLDFTSVTAEVGIDMSNSIFGDDVRLDGYIGRTALPTKNDVPSHIPSVDQNHLRNEMIAKALNLEGVEIRKHLYVYAFEKRRFHIRGQFDLRAKVGGHVVFLDAKFDAGTTGTAIAMFAATVDGSVVFKDKTEVTGKIDLRAKVTGQVAFDDVKVNVVQNTDAVDMTDAEVSGAVFFRKGTVIVGKLKMHQATFFAGFWTAESSTTPPRNQPTAMDKTRRLLLVGDLDISYVTVHGPMLFHGASVWGQVEANHLHVHGDLDWCGSVIGLGSPTASELDVRRASSERTQWTQHETSRIEPADPHRTVGFDMKMAKIEGRLWCMGTRWLGNIDLEDTQVIGEVNFENGYVAGNLRMRSIKIEGGLVAHTREPQGTAPAIGVTGYVNCSYSKIGAITYDFAPPSATTPSYVNLTGADVGVLQLRGTLAEVERHDASRGIIVAEGLKFQEMKLDANVAPTTTLGPSQRDRWRLIVWFVAVGLVGFLVIYRENPWLGLLLSGYVFASASARIDRPTAFLAVFTLVGLFLLGFGYWWFGIPLLVYVLRQPDARITVPSCFPERGNASTQWQYYHACIMSLWRRSMYLPRQPNAVLNLLDWSYPFSRSFYITVENWLRNAGDDARADEAFLMRRRRETGARQAVPTLLENAVAKDPALREDWQPPSKAMIVLNSLFDFAMGFGVRWGRLVHVYVLLFLLNIGVFLAPRSVERPIAYVQPRFDTLAKDSTAKKNVEKELENPWPADGGVPGKDEWTIANAAFMALRVQVPVLTLGAENDWEPASRPMLGSVTYEEYASFMVVANFILIPLIIAGITRQMRK